MTKTDQNTSPLPEKSLQTACKVLLETFKVNYVENVFYVIVAANKCLNPLIERLIGLLKLDEAYQRIGSYSQSTNQNGSPPQSNTSNYDDLIVDIVCVLTTVIDGAYYHLKTFDDSAHTRRLI